MKKEYYLIIIVILVCILIGELGYFTLNMKKNNDSIIEEIHSSSTTTNNSSTINSPTSQTTSTTTQTTTKVIITDSKDELKKISDVSVNGVFISFPTTKSSFDKVGWVWNDKYAKQELPPNYSSMSGGRIGTYPGGVVVNVYNDSDVTKKYEECLIYSGTFYNPKDGSEDVKFINNLSYSSSIDDVKNTFNSLGYKNADIRDYDGSSYLKYFLDDNKSNYRDYIEFYFLKDVIYSVTVSVSFLK